MATLEELIVRIEADNSRLVAALEESAKVTSKSTKQMEDSIQKFSESGTKDTNKFGNVMTVFAGTILANITMKAFEMVGQAVSAFTDLLAEGVAESAQFEQSMQKVANSLALSGQFSQDALDSIKEFSNEMERLSGIDDAVIASNVALLSSMTKLSSEGLMRAQQAALDLSAAMNIDLQTATRMVGKAANGETDSFKKLGIDIRETGDRAGTLANTLTVLEGRFKGASGGALQGFSGNMLAAKNAVGNFFQTLGDVVTQNPVVIKAIQQITKIFGDLEESLKGNAQTISKDFGQAFAMLLQITKELSIAIDDFVRVTITGFKTIALAGQSIVDTLQSIWAAAQGSQSPGKAFKESEDAWDSLVTSATSKRTAITQSIIAVADAASQTADTMTGEGTKVVASVQNQVAATKELTWAEKVRMDQAAEFAKQLADQSLSVSNSYKMQQDALQLVYENQTISFETYKAAKLASQADMLMQEQAMLDQARAAGSITEQQYQAAGTQLHQQHTLQRMKLNQDLKKQEEELQKARLQGYSTFFGGLASLSQSSNQTLAGIGKAAAISQATIDAYLAIQNALANVPYPANIAAAAGIGIQAFANVSKIAGVGLKSGIDSVPGVGTTDQFPAMLAPGERVVPSETNQDLVNFLERNREGSGSSNVFNLNFYGPVWSDKATAGADIVEAINEAISRGMSLRLLST